MKVTSFQNPIPILGNTKQQPKEVRSSQADMDNNPISKFGEKSKLVKATAIAGLGVGARLLWELADGDFLFEIFDKKAGEIVKRNHSNAKGYKQVLLHIGAFIGVVGMALGGFSLLYTLFHAPKINYEGNVNAFKNKKDMDVYIKGNKAEKEIYTQMNEKAKIANKEEKNKLKVQYIQMQMAKNQLPQFIKK